MLDAIVVGAGAAGLAAAGALDRAGREVVVLEARSRIGGRVHTLHDPLCPTPIELGAEMVHVDTDDTVRMLRELGLPLTELEGSFFTFEQGRLRGRADFGRRLSRALDAAFAALGGRGDRSIADAAMRAKLSRRDRDLLRTFVEGFHAGDATRIGARGLSRGDQGPGRTMRVVGGYGVLCTRLAAGIERKIRLGRRVTRIAHRRREVRVGFVGPTGRESELTARAAIVALPLPVIDDVAFDPPLDEEHAGALSSIGMGPAVKITLRFRTPFWIDRCPALARASMLLVPGAPLPTFWSARPILAPVLVAWAGGPAADRLWPLDGAGIAGQALETLARVLGMRAAAVHDELEAFHHHDWSADPFARGAYSFPLVGGADAAAVAAKPIGRTLFFAGEHTSAPPDNATVDAAIRSGERAARELRSLVRSASR